MRTDNSTTDHALKWPAIRRSLFVVLAVLSIAVSPTIGFAKDPILDEIRKLGIHDSKIRKDVLKAAVSVARCDPAAARRRIRNLKKIEAAILLEISIGVSVSAKAKQDRRAIRDALVFLDRRLRQHCGTRRVSDNTLGHTYGFFVENSRKFAQDHLNIALAAAKACNKAAFDREVKKIFAAVQKSREAARANAKFRDQYAGDATALEALGWDLRYKWSALFKHCDKADARPKTHSAKLSRPPRPTDKPKVKCIAVIGGAVNPPLCVVGKKIVYGPADGHIAHAIWTLAPRGRIPVKIGLEIPIHAQLRYGNGKPVGRGDITYAGAKIELGKRSKAGKAAQPQLIFHWGVSPDYRVRLWPVGAEPRSAAILTIIQKSAR